MAVRKKENSGLGEDNLLIETARHVNTASPFRPAIGLQEVLQTILEQLGQYIDYDACMLLLLTDTTLSVGASRGFPNPAEIARLQFDLKEHPNMERLIDGEQPTISLDVLAAGPLWDAASFMSSCACAKIPLLYQNRSIGLLITLKEELDYYSDEDAQAVMAFASQAAMTIQNARLYAETQRRALQMEAVSQVSQKVTAILDVDELLAQVAWLIRDKFGYHHVHIFLVDGQSNEIVLRQGSSYINTPLKTQGLRLKIGEQGITGWVAGTGQPLLCNDVSQEPRYHPHELLPETCAELAIPLRIGEVVVGVLDVQSEQQDVFQNDDIIALQILADQVAIAIENANLFQQARLQYQAMRVLHDISLELTSQLDSKQVLRAILKQATHLLRAQGSTLSIYDPDQGVIRKIAVHNAPPEFQGVTLRKGEGVVGQVVATGKPLIVNDYRHWAGRSSKFRDGPYDAIIGVPMRWQGQVFGALTVLDRGERRPFTEDNVRLLSLFADMASIALKNAELYAQVTQAGQQLEQKVAQRTGELAQAREELAHKTRQLQRLLTVTVQIQEEERIRIARDLHDEANQLITGTLYEIQAAQQSILDQRTEVALEKLETAKGLLRKIEAENRRIISGLRPAILDTHGLVPALTRHVDIYQERYQISCSIRISSQPVRLSPEAETAVYRIVQESLNNVAAHAQAQNVQIWVDFRPTQLRVIVEDDGIGFDYESVLTSAPGRMGLIGVRERAQSIGGQIEVQSLPGHGTRIALSVPLPEVVPI